MASRHSNQDSAVLLQLSGALCRGHPPWPSPTFAGLEGGLHPLGRPNPNLSHVGPDALGCDGVARAEVIVACSRHFTQACQGHCAGVSLHGLALRSRVWKVVCTL